MQRLRIKRCLTFIIVFAGTLLVSQYWCELGHSFTAERTHSAQHVSNEHNSYVYNRSMPLIFIGGMPRSGTTLMRVMLDAHPDVRCGEETRVIPQLLGLQTDWQESEKESKWPKEAGLTNDVLSSAVAAFILEVIAKHGEPAPRLCNKDPYALEFMVELANLFPNAKFLLMIRDGRAVVHSIMSRNVTIFGFDLNNFRSCLERWNTATENMYYHCLRVGSDRCLPIFYEQLVLHPEPMMRNILTFLDISWHSAVLHHHELINKPGGISLSKVEKSTDQVIKPVNVQALGRWAEFVPDNVRRDIHKIAPMLSLLGYDSDSYPPTYGKADDLVANNTLMVQQNEEYWQRRLEHIQQATKDI